MSEGRRPPRRAVVVGAGMVGLATAWFLQDRGVEVTVVERDGVAAGASWGNAGWLSPGLAVPLPDPSVLRYGLRALLDPAGPLYVPRRVDPRLWWFLVRFARHCTFGQWRRAMAGYLEINRQALAAYDQLAAGGVEQRTVPAPIVAGFEHAAQASGLRHELQLMSDAGQHVEIVELSSAAMRTVVPQLSERVEVALRLDGPRYIDPGAFVGSLAAAVTDRGGTLRTGFSARTFHHGPRGVTVAGDGGEPEHGDVAVVATGAWLDQLARPLGVKVPVRAGRGYSFSVDVERPVPCPVYFPVPRVACTPYQGRLRVGGTMEFSGADAPLDPRRAQAIVDSARPLLVGVDWASATDTWVGPRPVTPDGLPLVGATLDPDVYVAGGHGMWGITLGPVTGRLLAEQIVTGRRPDALAAFDPLR